MTYSNLGLRLEFDILREIIMANVGYIRVSSTAQNTERQLEGLALDDVFTDKVSGKSLDRPALRSCSATSGRAMK